MHIMEQVTPRISRKNGDEPVDKFRISKVDLDRTIDQLQLSKIEFSLCIFAITGGIFTSYYQFLKGLHELVDKPTIVQEAIDQTLGNRYSALLRKQDLLTKLKNVGYRIRKSKNEIFKTE